MPANPGCKAIPANSCWLADQPIISQADGLVIVGNRASDERAQFRGYFEGHPSLLEGRGLAPACFTGNPAGQLPSGHYYMYRPGPRTTNQYDPIRMTRNMAKPRANSRYSASRVAAPNTFRRMIPNKMTTAMEPAIYSVFITVVPIIAVHRASRREARLKRTGAIDTPFTVTTSFAHVNRGWRGVAERVGFVRLCC
jgi:hypothetical protein